MTEELVKQRTHAQNNALHLYLSMVANELQNQGQTLQNIVKAIKKVEIIPTKENLKEVVWREIQKAILGKESTTFLTKHEVTEVYEVMSMWLAKNFGIDIPFPNDPDPAPLLNKLK
jgi:hypothetical protein